MSQSSDDRGVMPRMQPVKYIAELEHVREVSIREGDLQFWQEYLRRHELVPLSRDGRAHILIVAAKMRYMGLPFSEVSFSVEVVNPLNTKVPAAFLISAFNSSRLFAWSERLFFRTPYVHAGCDMQDSLKLPWEVTPCSHVLAKPLMAGKASFFLIGRRSEDADLISPNFKVEPLNSRSAPTGTGLRANPRAPTRSLKCWSTPGALQWSGSSAVTLCTPGPKPATLHRDKSLVVLRRRE